MSATHAAIVLNVDDNAANRYARTRLLERQGYRVLEAATGFEALQLLHSERPALVILDVQLPDISGFDICKQIKEDRATAGTRVMQISAYYTSIDDRKRGLKCRADSYLMEPVPSEEFLATVQALLTLPNREQELQHLVNEAETSHDAGELAQRHIPEQRRLLAAQLEVVKDQERARLAQSLHDDLVQLLVVARLKLHQLRQRPVEHLVLDIDALLKQCLTYTRSLMSDLMPPEVFGGRMDLAIRWLAASMRSHGLTVDVEVPEKSIILSKDTAMTMVKCVRELLFNVLKHSGTQQAVVRMVCGDGNIQITVLDHGKGCDQLPMEGSAHRSFGLVSVQQRLESLGGRLDIVSHAGSGTRATLVVPYEFTGSATV